MYYTREMCKVMEVLIRRGGRGTTAGSASSRVLEGERIREGKWRTQDHGVLYQCPKAGNCYWVSLTRVRNPLERGGIEGGVIPPFSTSYIFAGR